MLRACLFTLLASAFAALASAADPGPPAISPEDFDRLRAEIKPHKGESPWRDIHWLTSVHRARLKAAEENKPLVFFTAADGSPLART